MSIANFFLSIGISVTLLAFLSADHEENGQGLRARISCRKNREYPNLDLRKSALIFLLEKRSGT
jgi:hypothetical protein